MDETTDMFSKSEDVSKEIFELCKVLNLGQLVHSPEFNLQEAMSSVELMDPKMDSGMRRLEKKLGLQTAIANGLYNDDLRVQIAVIDGTFSMLVAWLEGHSLAQTLWTNVMLAEVEHVNHPFFSPLSHAFVHIVMLTNSIIRGSATFEEEDFASTIPFDLKSSLTRDVVVRQLRSEIAELAKAVQEMNRLNTNDSNSKFTLAIGARLEMACLILEILTLLTPPERPRTPTPPVVQRVDEYDSDTSEESGIIEKEEEEENEDLQFPPFKPNYDSAKKLALRLVSVSTAIYETANMGVDGPESGDGDFGWLHAFEPELNRRFLPSAFPRKANIPDRVSGLKYMMSLAKRLLIIASNAESSTIDLTSLFYFARSFNIDNSCVLTRSVLQLTLFPYDEHIGGDENHTIADPIEESLKNMFAPLILQKGSPVYHDSDCQRYYNNFLQSMGKVALNVYQIFGCNMARQRDRLITVIEELGNVHLNATRVELRTEEVLRDNDIAMADAPYHSIATFVLNNMIALVCHYFELSLRMDLFVPYEFTYIYWYMGDILARWQISTMERSQDMMIQGWKQNPLSTNTNPRRTKEKQRAEEAFKKRLQLNQLQMVHQFGLCQLSEGVVKLTVALIKLKKIKVPMYAADSEKHRFESRVAPFKSLGPPLYMDYEKYKELSRIDEKFELPVEQLVSQALESFDVAKHHLEKLMEKPELRDDSGMYLKIAKTNYIGARLMKTQDLSNRKVEWVYSEECPIYPQLRIS